MCVPALRVPTSYGRMNDAGKFRPKAAQTSRWRRLRDDYDAAASCLSATAFRFLLVPNRLVPDFSPDRQGHWTGA